MLEPKEKKFLITLILCSAVCTIFFGCFAQRPPINDGTIPNVGAQQYASIATCTPKGICPGSSCTDNVIGPPDENFLDMAECPILDIAFTGGTILREHGNDADLIIHVQQMPKGYARVEASNDNQTFVLIGTINGQCSIPISENKIGISLTTCNTIDNVNYLRITSFPSGNNDLNIDAIEALSFSTEIESQTNDL